jgi:hypothetical protein
LANDLLVSRRFAVAVPARAFGGSAASDAIEFEFLP